MSRPGGPAPGRSAGSGGPLGLGDAGERLGVGMRSSRHAELQEAVEEQAKRSGAAPVRAEAELVEVGPQVVAFDRSPLGPCEPSLGERRYAVNGREQLAGFVTRAAMTLGS